ncbi:AraC family transcriptional regulator [Microbulbifer hainanensis]|uniref:AraC family transcriptional regulator n=1 Tax=Microbulbifer hainanensis TaxID=2735675 RepID=UPI0018685B3C|nr:AraC family transcriptional regulator [Microbulbifer hainanensis]
MTDFMLPPLYLRQIAELLETAGADSVTWLQGCDIEPGRLADPAFQPTYPQFIQLIERAVNLSAEPALGLLLGERLQVNTHGILGFAALQSESLRQAIQLAERYLALRITLVTMRHVQGKEARTEHLQIVPNCPLGAAERTVLEAVMLAIKNIFDTVNQGKTWIEQVYFPFAETGYSDLARRLFDCPVTYGHAWAGFAFAPGALDSPLGMSDPMALRDAERICKRELEKIRENTSLGARIHRILLERRSAFPSLEVIARLLHMTPRTLHRRLQEEGTSFRVILEEVRHTLALEYLRAGRLAIQEIAYNLGYNDVANFRRAFKRWEGVAPSVYGSRAGG